MRVLSAIALFGVVVCPLLLTASPNQRTSTYQRATVIRVEKKEVRSPEYTGGDNPSDAPLRSEYYAYDVSVHVSGGTYVGYYGSEYDSLPSEFSPNHAIDLRLTKHHIYFNLPGDRELKMAIVHRSVERGGVCLTSTATR
jgi:hypothetical protein